MRNIESIVVISRSLPATFSLPGKSFSEDRQIWHMRTLRENLLKSIWNKRICISFIAY